MAVKNRRNAAANPLAHFRKEITVEEILARPIADPLNLLDCFGDRLRGRGDHGQRSDGEEAGWGAVPCVSPRPLVLRIGGHRADIDDVRTAYICMTADAAYERADRAR